MAIYLEFEGIKGNVTAEGYKGHIDLDSVMFNGKRVVSMQTGHLTNREASQPSIEPITISKRADSSVISLFKEFVGGSTGKKATIKFVQTGSDKLREFMSYTLENCMVSGYSQSAGADGHPSETLQLSFSKIFINFKDTDATNKSGNVLRAGYDLAAAKVL